jgi:ferredoxin-type protein NapH
MSSLRGRWLHGRFWVQLAATLVANNGLLRATKGLCWPGLNCWACPSAAFACPLGALQNSFAAWRWRVAAGGLAAALLTLPWYVLGTLLVVGGLLGRMACGWVCPFGWFQELLARLGRPRLRLPRWLGYPRYLVLLALILLIPYYTGQPWFCKLCPQGYLEAGLPQPLLRPALRAGLGWLWYTKLAIFLAFAGAALFIRRPFCALACPLGALYGLMQRHSLWRTLYLPDKCTHCLWCVRACPQGIDPRRDLDSHLCIGCLECRQCPFGAIVSVPAWRVAELLAAHRAQSGPAPSKPEESSAHHASGSPHRR